ncbi:T-cell receptor beta variable [Clarias magur]|nr:T-cell receptor beta variable [Clarias magur]
MILLALFQAMLSGLLANHHGVEQSPFDMIKNPKDSAQLYCSYSVKNFEHILWYKESGGRNLIYLGYQNIKYTYSEPEAKINLDEVRNRNATLTVNNLIAKDSTVYFCAVEVHILAEDNGVTQNPGVAWHLRGESAELKCSHNKGGTYNQMYWYRQRQGESMELIVFTRTGSDPEFGSVDKSFSQNSLVIQKPPDLFGDPKGSVKIQCEHSVPSYNQINWYRQSQDRTLTFIGYQYAKSSKTIEKDFESKVEMAGDGSKNVSLTISDLVSSDSMVYFCAAYYTVLQICFIQYKNLCVSIHYTSLTPAAVAWN